MKDWTRITEFRWDHKDGSFIVCELDGSGGFGSPEHYRLFNRWHRELSNGRTLDRLQGRHEELKRDFPEVFLSPLASGMKEIR